MPTVMDQSISKEDKTTNVDGSMKSSKCPFHSNTTVIGENGSLEVPLSPSIDSGLNSPNGTEDKFDHTLNGSPNKNGSESPSKNGPESPNKNGSESPNKNESESPNKNGSESPDKNGSESSDKNESESSKSRSMTPIDKTSSNGGNETAATTTDDAKDEFKTISLKLLLPGHTDTIDIIHLAKDSVNDLLQYAYEKPDHCYKSCLSVRLNGHRLDKFSELGSIPQLKNNSTVELVEEPYTLRDIFVHIQRLQELLSATDILSSSFSCTNGTSLSFLSSFINTALMETVNEDSSSEVTTPLPPEYITSFDSSRPLPLSHFFPPNFIQSNQTLNFLKKFCYSSFNPPPSNRKFKGDLLYIDVKTNEGDEFCITACPSGFFLNRSVPEVTFDPAPRKVAHHCQHLVILLQQISGSFRKYYNLLQKESERKNAYEVFPVPYPVYPWTVPKLEVKPLVFRTDDCVGLKVQTDELLVGQLRDWNQELQTTRELPTSSIQHRLYRDRALFKVHSDFVQVAVRGAMAAVDGQLHPLNPAEPDRNHMYLWNNIFFSTGFDGRGHFKDFGGDEAGHAASNYDLQGVALLEALNIKGLHTLGAVLIDYRGYRVFAQTIVPGLLQREQETSIVYGSMDNGKTFTQDESFHKLLIECAEKLHLRIHKVKTEAGEEIELPVSLEVKGITGTDSRHYVLDLFRILPPDVNYSDCIHTATSGDRGVEKEEEGKEEGAAAVNNKLRHKMYILRPELIDTFVHTSQRLAVELHMLEEMKKNLSKDPATKGKEDVVTDKEGVATPSDSKEKIHNTSNDKDILVTPVTTTTDTMATDVTMTTNSPSNSNFPVVVVEENEKKDTKMTNENGGDKLNDSNEFDDLLLMENIELEKKCDPELEAIPPPSITTTATDDTSKGERTDDDKTGEQLKSSLLNFKDFDVRFNADILAPGMRHNDPPEELEKDRQLVTDLAGFLTKTVIPKFVRDCVYLNLTPMDSTSLKTQLHARGINIRYLGKIAMLAKTREDLSHLHRLCLIEMILRTAKRRLRKALLSVPLHRTAATVAHVLSCLLTDIEEGLHDEATASSKKKSKKKKNVGGASVGGGGGGGTVKTTPSSKSDVHWSQGKLWKTLVEDINDHYLFTIEQSSLTQICKEFQISKVAILREFCLKTGIQILLKDYKFSSPVPFNEDDIINMVPVVKHTDFKPLEATALFELAQVQLQSGNTKVALEYFHETLQLFTQVYGPLHVNIANCYRVIARIYHALGETNLALTNQHKASIMFERLLGVDHSSTITAYFHLAQYCCAGNKTNMALQLLYRVKYLALLVHGEDHPEMANIDFYIGLILGNSGHHLECVPFLEKALSLEYKYHGSMSITVATTHHLLANSLTHNGSFADAKQHERKAYNIYRTKLGPDHARTTQSYKDARYITEKQISYNQTLQLAQGISNKSSSSKQSQK